MRGFFTRLVDMIVSVFALILSKIIRRKDKNVAFGSWCGELYIDNSKYLAEYIMGNHPEYTLFWVGNKELKKVIPSDMQFLELNRLSSIPKLLSCKTFFFTQMHRPDICKYNVYSGAVLCLLDHGNALKKWAMDATGYSGELEYKNFSLLKKIYTNIVGENIAYKYITVSSHKTAQAYSTALAYRMDKDSELIETGLPRNDYLINRDNESVLKIKEKYAELLGFNPNKKVVMYLPTFRRKTEKIESFAYRAKREMNALDKLMEDTNTVFLEKNHFAADKFTVNKQTYDSQSIIKVEVPVDVQEMLEFTDVLISDYSGCILDYIVLDRPIIYYLYDYEEYKNEDSGLYYDVSEFAAGCVAKNFSDVYNELYRILVEGKDDYGEKREKVKKELSTYDDGHSSERVFDIVLGQ